LIHGGTERDGVAQIRKSKKKAKQRDERLYDGEAGWTRAKQVVVQKREKKKGVKKGERAGSVDKENGMG
jgi:hypothetical protein